MQLRFSSLSQLGLTSWWRVAVTGAAVVTSVFLGQIPLSLLLASDEQVLNRGFDFSSYSPEKYAFDPDLYLLCVLLPFATGLLALLLCVRYVHRRASLSVVTAHASVRWGRLLAGFTLWLALLSLAELLNYALNPQDYTVSYEPGSFATMMLVVLAFIPPQIAFEELAIRGYLHQEVTHRTAQPLLGVVASSLVFGVLHLGNPEIAKFGVGLMLPYYVGVGLMLALVSVLDDGLELALGVHLATNMYGASIVNFEGSALPSSALVSMSQMNAPLTLSLFVVQAAIFTFAFAKTSPWKLARFRKVHAV